MENKEEFFNAIKEAVSEEEKTNIALGIELGDIKREYFYEELMKFLKGDTTGTGSIYFVKLKPLYDKFGYEKVNRHLLAIYEAEKENGANE